MYYIHGVWHWRWPKKLDRYPAEMHRYKNFEVESMSHPKSHIDPPGPRAGSKLQHKHTWTCIKNKKDLENKTALPQA